MDRYYEVFYILIGIYICREKKIVNNYFLKFCFKFYSCKRL